MPKTVTLPTERHRDTAIVLLFLSAVSYYIIPLLAQSFGLSRSKAALISTPAGIALTGLAVILFFFARKRVIIEPGKISIKDGLFARAQVFSIEAKPVVKLASYELEDGGHSQEIWTVHLSDQGHQYLIDSRKGSQQILARSLSEQLAKTLGANLIETSDGQPQEFRVEELDIPFIQRVQLYPSLLGHPVAQPTSLPCRYHRSDNTLKVSWSYLQSSLLLEVMGIAFLLLCAGFIPLPGNGEHRLTLYGIAQFTGDYRYFIGVGLFAILSLILLGGYRTQLSLDLSQDVQARSSLWGLPIKRTTMALSELEQVGANLTSRGSYLLLVSDRHIVKTMMASTETARWLAWEIRDFLAKAGSVSAHPTRST